MYVNFRNSLRKLEDPRKEGRPWWGNLTVLQIYKVTSLKGLGEEVLDELWKLVECVKLKAKGIAHKHCTLVNNVSNGSKGINSYTAICILELNN